MIKVMIVDDEVIFRDYLRTLIPWNEYGMEIISEARNGVDALERIQEQSPDLVLVDINMPFMDGLELTEQIRQRNDQILVVLVTGHNEFEYARRALKLGVQDYILKPFSKDELVLTLLNLQSNIRKVQEEKLTLQANESMLKELYLNRLIQGEVQHGEQEFRDRLAAMGYPAVSGSYQVACIEIDNMEAKWREISDRELWKFAVKNILNETMQLEGNLIVFNGPEGRIISIYELGSASSEAYIAGCEQLNFLIKKYLKFTVTVGVGHVYPDSKGIRESYQEAIEALHNKFVVGSDTVIVYGEDQGAAGRVTAGFISSQTNESLLLALRMNDWQSIHGQLEEIFQDIKTKRLSIDYVYVICMGLVSVCLSCVTENGHPIEDCFGEDFYPYSEIMKKQSIDDAACWIEDLYTKANDYIKLHKQTKSDKIAEAAQHYIDSHYSDSELKVEQIAQHIYINPSYLRAVFKKVHGLTVTDYLTKKRMQTARELLSSGKHRVADVALQIGYNDPAYFSRAFKKYYGYSPSEFEGLPGS
ncbi:response regulator [Paenibacillus sp. GCM10023252]|uniref:response regulator n=1 Tax=Paenibacillus sp. GCM10023252 TaxID=3252649 RepID=UPI003611649A